MSSNFSNSRWSGWIGSPPAHEDFIKAVTQQDLFVYMGHGAGEKYLSSRVFDEIQDMCTCFLMGCSSGHLRDFGDFERRGTVLKYLGSGRYCHFIYSFHSFFLEQFVVLTLTVWMVFLCEAHVLLRVYGM
jgi:hypothetical protein